MNRRTPQFRVLELFAPSDEAIHAVSLLETILEDLKTQHGYFAFYSNISQVVSRYRTSPHELRHDFLKALGKDPAEKIIDPCDPDKVPTPMLEPGKLHIPGDNLKPDYAAKTYGFIENMRKALTETDNKGFIRTRTFAFGKGFKDKNAFALHHATVFDVIGDPFRHSQVIHDTLGYKEYLLWDDGGLWDDKDWQAAYENLHDQGLIGEQAEQRLAWTGSGWISLQLEQACEEYKGDPCPVPPELAMFADSALLSLEAYDKALLEYYAKEQRGDPPGFKAHTDYIRCLCNFLPDHRSRINPNKWLSSNTLGEEGGPRLWQGILDGRLHMHLLHLLLDGWLTLWPFKEANGKTNLYLQPGSLALLYWAASFADMPHTESPQAFLEKYDWSDKKWFGGQRQHWTPQR